MDTWNYIIIGVGVISLIFVLRLTSSSSAHSDPKLFPHLISATNSGEAALRFQSQQFIQLAFILSNLCKPTNSTVLLRRALQPQWRLTSAIIVLEKAEQVVESNQMEESPDVPEIDPMLDLDNEDEAGYNEIPTPQSEFSSRRRGRPCGGSSTSQQSKKKMTTANFIVEPLNKLADAIERSSDGVIERKFAEEINQALFEMYDIDSIDKVAIAMGFLMKNKWAATSVLSTPKEKRVTLLDAIMRTSTSNH